MAASLGNATVNVLARTVLFEQSLRRSLKRMSALTAAVFAGVAGANFMGEALKDSIALEKQIARIHTLLNTPAERGIFSPQSLRDFSNEMGLAVDTVADSLFYLLSSGIKASDAMEVLRQSSKTAAAQLGADLTKVADFASSALNAFGGEMDRLTKSFINAETANDILNRALDEGKGTMNDFAKYISTAIPIADSLGISLSEIAAAGATSTITGMSARKAFTGLKVAMQELNDEGHGLGEAFQELTGKTFRQFVKEGGTLQEGIRKLGKEFGAANITTVAGAKEGGAAIQQLLQLWPQYENTLTAVGNSAGTTASKFEIVDRSLSRQLERIRNQFRNFRGSVGDWLGPIVADALDNLRELAPHVKARAEELWQGIAAGAQMVGELLRPGFEAIRNAIEAVDWESVTSVIRAVFEGLAIGAAPVIAAVAGLMTAVGAFIHLLGGLFNVLNQMKPVITAVVAGFIAYKTTLLALLIVQKAQLAIQKLQVAWTAAVTAAQLIQIGATSGLAGAWTALTLVMSANPLGLAIAAIAALAVGFTVAWKKSETFREVVAAAINGIVAVTVTAVKAWLNLWLGTFQLIAEGFDKTFGNIARALGINVADMSQKVEQFRNNVNGFLDGIKDNVHITVTANADQAIAELEAVRQAFEAATGKKFFGPIPVGTKFENGRLNYPGAFDDLIGIDSDTYAGGGGGGGAFSGGRSSAGDDKKKKAADAKKKFKEMLERIGKDLVTIAKETSKQTISELQNNFERLYENMDEAGFSKLIGGIKKVEAKLVKLAKSRDSVLKKLDLARDSLKNLQDEHRAWGAQLRSNIRAMGSVANETDGIGVTYTGIRNRLQKTILVTTRFVQTMEKLRKLGLNQTSLRELYDAGPAAMDQAAVLAASGAKGIKEINNLQAQLKKSSDALATSGYNEFYKLGVAQAKGLIEGLEKERNAIVKQMDKIADALVASIKKKLKIKSPSRVFGEVGENISKGLANGIESGASGVKRASNTVTQQITFGPGSVAVNGVNPTAAQRAGIVTGQGIVQVLNERRIAAQIAGVS